MIQSIKEAQELKTYCKSIGREGMGDIVSELAKKMVDCGGDYVELMKLAGQVRAITTGVKCDCYFGEKVNMGFTTMYYQAKDFNNKTK